MQRAQERHEDALTSAANAMKHQPHLRALSLNHAMALERAGRGNAAAERMLEDAAALEAAGACAIVLELVPASLAQRVSAALRIPTIGIGAGPGCDGQVLVLHDMLGLNETFAPKFLKRYAEMAEAVRNAVGEYSREVREGKYPGKEHSFE